MQQENPSLGMPLPLSVSHFLCKGSLEPAPPSSPGPVFLQISLLPSSYSQPPPFMVGREERKPFPARGHGQGLLWAQQALLPRGTSTRGPVPLPLHLCHSWGLLSGEQMPSVSPTCPGIYGRLPQDIQATWGGGSWAKAAAHPLNPLPPLPASLSGFEGRKRSPETVTWCRPHRRLPCPAGSSWQPGGCHSPAWAWVPQSLAAGSRGLGASVCLPAWPC